MFLPFPIRGMPQHGMLSLGTVLLGLGTLSSSRLSCCLAATPPKVAISWSAHVVAANAGGRRGGQAAASAAAAVQLGLEVPFDGEVAVQAGGPLLAAMRTTPSKSETRTLYVTGGTADVQSKLQYTASRCQYSCQSELS